MSARTGKRVVLIGGSAAIEVELKTSLAARGIDLTSSASASEAEKICAGDDVLALIADSSTSQQDRDALLKERVGRHQPLLFVLAHDGPIVPLSPLQEMPLRRVPWPLPTGFVDQVRACGKPIVFLVDQTLFMTQAVTSALQQAGVASVAFESTMGLAEFLAQQAPEQPKKTTLWEKLSGSAKESVPQLGKIVTAQFMGSLVEAQAFDARIRQVVPHVVCYSVAADDPLRDVMRSAAQGQWAVLPHALIGRLPALLAAEGGPTLKQPLEQSSILLLDNFKPTLAALTGSLTGAGYDVVGLMNGEQALGLVQPGRFHLAVIGTALAYAQHSGVELAQKLREIDPDLRIIFMVDRYPLQTALQGVSQVVELGLDDALLKPVESSRLIFSVRRALERRSLIIENARLLKEVQESARQLSQINKFQTKFFATVAHDVKNPLTVIMGYAELLSSRLKNQPEESKVAGHMYAAARTLDLLISDLVDLAAIESGKLRVEMESLDLAGVIADVSSRITVVAEKSGLKLTVQVPAQLPALKGDPKRIGQVIQNLCTNAVQYTKRGGSVTITVDVNPDGVIVSVRDTGIGISKEDLPRVFERFFQTDEAQKMRKAGFGLGLKIAREIVQMHGGSVGLESTLGVGSRFYFTLPAYKEPAA